MYTIRVKLRPQSPRKFSFTKLAPFQRYCSFRGGAFFIAAPCRFYIKQTKPTSSYINIKQCLSEYEPCTLTSFSCAACIACTAV